MTKAYGDARSRLPREPYPGLRPFLDFEAALLFGRERQVREVIEHLRLSQFVAVLGGSGSGKSSLIHAGVVPELRSFGIPGAGDLWLPVTSTPGTNVSAADSAARRHSPVTRLARRFAGLLNSRGSAEADAQRQSDIAEVFRQEAGFARLLDVYGAELRVPPGPDPADARVLFVLDQFEEVFHPTNKGVADATLLVERVLDHFFNPHPRCHLVLTMRSEHLNDCASFLELPDAINKSSYLVRRLDDDELHGAIVGPAQRFLRLVARSQEGRPAEPLLPAEVQFEDLVLQRLLRDVKAITHDPDHLPLLQHLLARLWEAALEREEMDIPVPSHITEIDLVRAVGGGRAVARGDEQPLDERTNTLRACVENWPETIYQWQGPAEREVLDALFARLAYKDPNTGMYSQQRIDVEEVAPLLRPRLTSTELRALLAEGFLGTVDYLFWDDEDPARVTLKVSHESFIRGWARFRDLADREADRFEEFVGVLRRCSAWAAGRRSDDLLLESGEMRLLRESDFEARLRAPGQHERWFRFLQLHRDGARLGRLASDLDSYLSLSGQRLQQRERSHSRRRVWAWASLGTLVLVPPAFFSAYVQGPVTQRTELLLDAGSRANGVPTGAAYAGVGAADLPLRSLLRAAELVEEARRGESSRMTRFSQWLLEHLSWIPQVQRQSAYLAGVTALTEPQVNERLRRVLTGAVWAGQAPADVALAAAAAPMRDAACLPQDGGPGPAEALMGRLILAARAGAAAGPPRGLLVSFGGARHDNAVTVRSALLEPDGSCRYGQLVARVPQYHEPHVLVDSALRHVLISTEGSYVEQPAVAVLELDWQRSDDGQANAVQVLPLAEVAGRAAVQQVRALAGTAGLAQVGSWAVPGGRALAIGALPWRLVAPGAQPLQVQAGDADFEPLQPAPPGSECAQLAQALQVQADPRSQLLAHGERCFHVLRGNAEAEPGESAGAPLRERVAVRVYDKAAIDRSLRRSDTLPAPVASMASFGRLGLGDQDWRVGVRGNYAGWLAVGGVDSSGVDRLLGLPMSTCALWRLGQQLLPLATTAPGEPADAAAVRCEGR